MEETVKSLGGEGLYPLSHRLFSIEDCVSAFRYMAQGKHIGKVVISMLNAEVMVTPPRRKKISFRDDSTYLITGGLGGFGLAVAQWMVEQGARHLALTGRSLKERGGDLVLVRPQPAVARILSVMAPTR